MPKHLHLKLHRKSMSAPVTHAVDLRGTLGVDGVDAWYWGDGASHIVLIADSPDNSGVSATNGYAAFAEVVRRHVGEAVSTRVMTHIKWFEYDSTGAFDEAQLSSDEAGFLPLQQPGCQPRTAEAFLARVQELAPASRQFWAESLEQIAHLPA